MPYFYVEFTDRGCLQHLVEASDPGEALEVSLSRGYSIGMVPCTEEDGSNYKGWFKAGFHAGPVDEEEREEDDPEGWAEEKENAWR
jgi:hypothetical protein